VLVVIYLVLNLLVLRHTVADPALAEKMRAKDSRQYMEIAQDFARGDFRMTYVQNMPHRQPLYSLLLAPAMKVWGDNLFALGCVNIVVGLALLICLFRGLLALSLGLPAAALASLAFIANPFMIDKISCRLMTEPVHALCLVLLILCFLAYAVRWKSRYLLGAAAAAGLDYLARTNGLFIIAATLALLALWDLGRLVAPKRDESPRPRWSVLLLSYLGAVVIVAVVTIPTWLPRYHYFKDPFHHGYLSNFMWVDSYEEGHTGQAVSEFTWKDYVKKHGLHDFFHRWGEGFYRVYYDIPRHAEHLRYLYFLAALGLVLAFVKRRPEYCLLAGFMFIQLLPVVWTSPNTPGPRVAYGTLFPFELFFCALTLAIFLPFLAARFPWRQVSRLPSKMESAPSSRDPH
jgi:4-amino-4-deoxy-L-arabinose transferase-like glycosyltransferase